MQEIPYTRRRVLRTWIPGAQSSELYSVAESKSSTPLIDLASNDYLGLSRHPKLISAAKRAIESNGIGSGGSRLITGSRPIHEELEKRLASWLGRDRVLLFPSGFQANLAAVISLADRKTTIIADKLIHHSLLLGVKASQSKLFRFRHNDLNDLEKILQHLKEGDLQTPPLVMTESLFSMEGTSPSINEMASLCTKYGARLLVDEAHALGIIGPDGKGLCYDLASQVTMVSGTFGKAFGSGGAFLATDATLGDHLLQTSGAFKYTTALSPALAAAALTALDLISENPLWGKQLIKSAAIWRESIEANGWKKPPGIGPILSLVIGSDEKALSLQNQLESEGLLSMAIRPPTVPESTSRLRITVKKGLPERALARLIKVIASHG